jgi:hypothetical protein
VAEFEEVFEELPDTLPTSWYKFDGGSSPAPRIKQANLCCGMKTLLSSAVFVFFSFCTSLVQVAAADDRKLEVPGAPHLMPEDAVAYIRVDNATELRELLRESSTGKMLADPELSPFVGDAYGMATELFEEFGSVLELSLDELLSIPQGQVAICAMPARLNPEAETEPESKSDAKDESEDAIRKRLQQKNRQLNRFAGLFVIEAGDKMESLEKLIDTARDKVTDSGYVVRKQEVQSIQLERWLPPRSGRPPLELFRHAGTLVIGIGYETGSLALDHLLDRSDEPTLAERTDFVGLMSRCLGEEDTRPQMTFYIDPFNIVKRLVNRSSGGALVWPIIESLGLERLRGIGASTFAGGEELEGIMHVHVAIDPPRDGLLGVIRPQAGTITPPLWVPNDVSSYTSLNWRTDVTYENLGKIVTKFMGGRPFEEIFDQPLKKRFDIELKTEAIDAMTGRLVVVRRLQTPVKLNSLVSLQAIEFKDASAPVNLIAKIRDKEPTWLVPSTEKGQLIYRIRPDRQRNMPDFLRKVEPQITLIDNWILVSDSNELMQSVIATSKDRHAKLIEDLDFEVVVAEASGMLGDQEPFLLSFMRGADFLRQPYELIRSEDTRKFVAKQAETNPVAAKLLALLKRNEFPDFEKLERYFAPSATFGYDEPTGIHIGSITLRSTQDQ